MAELPEWDDSDFSEWAGRKATALAQYGEQAVAAVLRRYDADAKFRQLQQIVRERADAGTKVSFELFDEQYPTFPLRFVAVRVPYPHRDLTFERLFKRFTKTEIYKAWKEHADAIAEARLTGSPAIIFQVPAVSKFCVLHTYPRLIEHGTFCVRNVEKKTLVFETLSTLLEDVDWSL